MFAVMSRYWRRRCRSTGVPFHWIWPSAVTTILFFVGSTGGGGALVACGRSSFTARVCTGIVMMNMISNTSMTSMSGVVLMSIIGSADSGLVTDALIQFNPKLAAVTAAGRLRAAVRK